MARLWPVFVRAHHAGLAGFQTRSAWLKRRKCPICAREVRQRKVGWLPSGSQRYGCYLYGCRYTPEKKHHTCNTRARQKAAPMGVDGTNLGRWTLRFHQDKNRLDIIPRGGNRWNLGSPPGGNKPAV